jgi:hypothetical protein
MKASAVCLLYLTSLAAAALADDTVSAPAQEVNVQPTDGKSSRLDQALKSYSNFGDQNVQWLDRPATLTVIDLRNGQITWRRRIESIRLAFEYQLQRVFDSADDLEAEKQGVQVPSDLSFKLEYASNGEKFGCKYTLKNQKPDGMWFNGRETKGFTWADTTGSLMTGHTEGFESNFGFYNQCVGLAIPSEDYVTSMRTYVPAILAEKGIRLIERLCSVDGFPCHVVTDGYDTFWIDAAHGFGLRRRVRIPRINVPNVSANGPEWIACAKNFVEVDKGIWLPRLCESYIFTGVLDTPSTRNRLRSKGSVRVSSLSINDVNDSEFDFEFPVGTRVIDVRGKNKKAYTVPYGKGSLEKAISDAELLVDRLEQPRWPLSRVVKVVLVVALPIITLACILIYSRWSRTPSRDF